MDYMPGSPHRIVHWVSAGLWTTAHAILWWCWLGMLLWAVPGAMRLFSDFGTALPAAAALLFELGALVDRFYPLIVPLAFGATCLEFLAILRWNRRQAYRARAMFCAFNTLVPLFLILGTIIVLLVPYLVLIDELGQGG